jgi:ferredoxin
MFPTRVYHYRQPAAVILGLKELRKQGLTPRGLLFVALDPRGETYVVVPEDLDAVASIRVGDKLSLVPPLEGRYFHFDAVHRLPGDSVLWNGDRRLGDTGSAPEANLIPIPKAVADRAMDAASCIGCGACVAACKNASAHLFMSAKISHLALLPQGQVERADRVVAMVSQADGEGFGSCSNEGECEAVCPKEIPISNIARMTREYVRAVMAR